MSATDRRETPAAAERAAAELTARQGLREKLASMVGGMQSDEQQVLAEVLRDTARNITGADRRLFLSGRKIDAIRQWRLRTGLGLREARDAFAAVGLPFELDTSRREIRETIDRERVLKEGGAAIMVVARDLFESLCADGGPVDDDVVVTVSTRKVRS